jgi:pyruvate formate lyase activating enzyme
MKGFTPAQHARVCGIEDNGPILDFCRRLAALRRPMLLRYVLVPGLTDDEAEIGLLASFAASLGVIEKVEVLPFHQMGRYKWRSFGLDYTLEDTEPPSQALVDTAIAAFRAAGLASV